MAKLNQRRILRVFRSMPPSRFHAFNQRVWTSLKDNSNIPESTWAGNPGLLPSYFSTSQKHDTVYHTALYGSKLDIAEREMLQAQLIIYLDEIASLLEAAAVRNPDILLSSGFDLAKERRSRPRTNLPSPAPEDGKVEEPSSN